MKFTLIVCTYMRPKPLLDLLNSVKEQSLYPNQIIIVDGSTNDETKYILEQNIFENLIYFKVDETQRGLTKQRNFGISKVNKVINVVCFLDDDIILEANYFKNLINTYTENPQTVGVGGYITNEVKWYKANSNNTKAVQFCYDNWCRDEPSRFKIRQKLGLVTDDKPAFMPNYSHGRSVGFLPPSDKTYEVELFMGGVSSYKKGGLGNIKFSPYFEGYGLYEDADFCLRLSKYGKLYVNTSAKCEHFHNALGRPNMFKYGKMVIRNGWYVWRVKYPKPDLKARLKWNLTALLLTLIRFSNVLNSSNKKSGFFEGIGRVYGWLSLLTNKPKIAR